MMRRRKLGIVGGGQLGRMMIQAALDYDVEVWVLEASAECPCASVASRVIIGSLQDPTAVDEFGREMDAVTIEVEAVSVEGLRRLEARGVRVVPSPDHVELIQDKGRQKDFFRASGIPSAAYSTRDQYPVVQKLRRGGYDGRGVKLLRSSQDEPLSGETLFEELIDVRTELSVVVVRDEEHTTSFACCEQCFNEANVATSIVSPSSTDDDVNRRAEALAKETAEKLNYVGVLAVELFLTKSNEILVNELAPRCHNSGHHTIEACATSQFAQLVRVALKWPLGDATQTAPFAATINLLGHPETSSGPPAYRNLDLALAVPRCYPHVYAKAAVKPNRKMGHVTVLAESRAVLQSHLDYLARNLRVEAAAGD